MKKAKKQSSRKKKIEIIHKKSNLEGELKEIKKNIIEIKSDKKEIPPDEFIEDEFEDELEFREDFPKLRQNTKNSSGLENIRFGNSLEGGVIFAPRLKDRESKGKIYSSNKYDEKYNEKNYNAETPGIYAEKTGSEENSSSKNK